MSGPEGKKDAEAEAEADALAEAEAEAEAQAHAEAEAKAAAGAKANAGAPAELPPPTGMVPHAQVRFGQHGELAPHEAVNLIAAGLGPDPQIAKRYGRFKLAVVTTIALTIVFLELMWLAPGVGIGFGVLIAPILVYTLRVTRHYLANESGFRRGMANTGTVILTILGAWTFLFVTFITLVWSICNVSGR